MMLQGTVVPLLCCVILSVLSFDYLVILCMCIVHGGHSS